MTIIAEASIEINGSPEEVFGVIADIPNAPKWRGPVIEVRDFSGEPVGVGTTYTNVSKFLGKEFTIDFEVTAFEPGERFSERFSGAIPGNGTITLTAVDGGTHVHMYFEGEPSGFFGMAAPLLKGSIQKQIASDFDNLKKVIEG